MRERSWQNFFLIKDGEHFIDRPGHHEKTWIEIDKANAILRSEIAKAERIQLTAGYEQVSSYALVDEREVSG